MFGHQDDVIAQDQKNNAEITLPDSALSALTSAPVTVPPTDNPEPATDTPAITLDESASEIEPNPLFDEPAHTQNNDTKTDSNDSDTPKEEEKKEEPTVPSSSSVNIHTDDLLDIKNEALHDLSPLVDKLDLSPEEKFKTLMMLIQASDDQSFISSAYDLAKQISDEKVRAQALLDVVNEINYFMQKSEPTTKSEA